MTPSRSRVAFMVAPFIGLPLSACRTRGRVKQPSAQTALRTSSAASFGALALVDLPADDLAAVNVEHQVEIEEPAPDRAGHPGDVPAPDLAGAAGAVAGRWLVTRRRLGPAAMVLLPFSPQDAVEAGFRGDIAALVCEAGHDLAGRQALEGLAVAGVQHGPAFRLRQLVARCRPRSGRAAILRRAAHGSP